VAGRATLDRDLTPFRTAIAAGVPCVMVGTAVYPAYANVPAATSRAIVTGLLRDTLGFKGVTWSDDLATNGVRPWFPPGEATVRAVAAGIDLVYVAGNNGSGGTEVGTEAYSALLQAEQSGRLSHAALLASYKRIVALREKYG
jgi:beta-N-acetylhexosaminidase